MATYGPGNRLRSWNGQTITRDANGNLTSDGNSYVWNAKNRLVSATEPQGVQASFRYDPFDRHVSRTVTCVQTGHVYASINPMHRLTAIEKAPAPWRSHR